ncbi:MAG: hypothetical protein HYW50_02085 [Candidatus Diapherotrites archaeon]|nr:hypothetical protein [Candidatus Diapherotrites archaeon]
MSVPTIPRATILLIMNGREIKVTKKEAIKAGNPTNNSIDIFTPPIKYSTRH